MSVMTKQFTDLKNYSLNKKGVDLSDDQRIHWLICWLTDWEESESQSWRKDSLTQNIYLLNEKKVLHRSHSKKIHSRIYWLTEWKRSESQSWTKASLSQTLTIRTKDLLSQKLTHWIRIEANSVMTERFTDSCTVSLSRKGEDLRYGQQIHWLVHWIAE